MKTRRIILSELAIDARIGILEHELRATQPIHIDAAFDVIIDQPVNDLDISSVLDYRRLREIIVQECTACHVHLIETLSENISHSLFDEFPEIIAMRLKISKPMAFADCAAVSIEIERDRASL